MQIHADAEVDPQHRIFKLGTMFVCLLTVDICFNALSIAFRTQICCNFVTISDGFFFR